MAGIFGSGIIPGTPRPRAYLALVAFFDGDPARADAWLADLLAYAGDAATAEQLLAAAQALGQPANALSVLLTADVQREPLTVYAEQAPPIYDQTSREIPAGPIPTPITKSTAY